MAKRKSEARRHRMWALKGETSRLSKKRLREFAREARKDGLDVSVVRAIEVRRGELIVDVDAALTAIIEECGRGLSIDARTKVYDALMRVGVR